MGRVHKYGQKYFFAIFFRPHYSTARSSAATRRSLCLRPDANLTAYCSMNLHIFQHFHCGHFQLFPLSKIHVFFPYQTHWGLDSKLFGALFLILWILTKGKEVNERIDPTHKIVYWASFRWTLRVEEKF